MEVFFAGRELHEAIPLVATKHRAEPGDSSQLIFAFNSFSEDAAGMASCVICGDSVQKS
jgi:hypothetical protein